MLTQEIIEEAYQKLDEIELKRSMNIKVRQLPDITEVTILLDMVCIYNDIQLIYSAKIEDFKRAYPRSKLSGV